MKKILFILIIVLVYFGWNQSFRDHFNSQEYREALLRVEGAKGRGSGFLCRLDGRTVAVTSLHVLCAHPNFKLINTQGALLPVKSGAAAIGCSAAKLEVTGGAKALTLLENVGSKVNIGDTVVILGNDGEIKGKVSNVSPTFVEVKAPSFSGNNGGPMIHCATGKVIGVAVCLPKYWVDREMGVRKEYRCFGYRLDSVSAWEPLNWQHFYTQATQVERMERLSDDFVAFSMNIRKKQKTEGKYQSPAVQRAAQQLAQRSKARRMGREEYADLIRGLLKDLQFATGRDIQSFDARNAYDFFRSQVEEQGQIREAVYADMTQMIGSRRR